MSDIQPENFEKDYYNLQRLIEITKIINATLDIGKLLTAVMGSIKDILHTEASSLFFYEEETDELVFKATVGEASEKLTEKYRFNTTQGIAGWCATNRKSLIVNDVYSDERFNPNYDKMTGFKTKSIICAPLHFKGKLIGVVEGINPIDRQGFDQEDMRLFDLFAEQAVMAVQNAIIFEKSIERNRLRFQIDSAKDLFKTFYEPITLEKAELSATMISRPSTDFSGDIFTSREENDNVTIMMADSSLRSLPGAITASYIAGKITAFGRACSTCSDVLRHFAHGQKDIPVPKQVSLLYGKLYPEKNTFEYSLHGSIQILYFSKGKTRLLKANSEIYNDSIRRTRLHFDKDSVALIFTEGITKLKNKNGHSYGVKKLARSVDISATTDQILRKVLEATAKHRESYLTFLDQTLICIKRS